MAGAMGSFAYVSDDGRTYAIRLDVHNAEQAGMTRLDRSRAACPPRPANLHPRYIIAAHPVTNRQRRVVVGNVDNDLWQGRQTTITLRDWGARGLATEYLVLRRVAERQRR